jgi:hypothetical protein
VQAIAYCKENTAVVTVAWDQQLGEHVLPREVGWRRLNTGEPLRVYPRQRRCSHPGCDTRLCRYNPDDTCALHGGWHDRATRPGESHSR